MARNQLLYPLLIIILVCGCQQNSSDNHKNDAVSTNLHSTAVMNYSGSRMQRYAEKAYTVLVDQHYKFPSSADFEQMVNDVYHINIKKSKVDDVDLSEENGPVPIAIRQKNFVYVFDPLSDREVYVDPELTFNLNNYLFYKNIKSRDLLLNSKNKDYLFDLVVKYGYINDEFLLKCVLDEKYKNDDFEKLGSIIFIKKPDGNLEIKTAVLNSIAANTNQNDVILAKNVLLYCINLIDREEDNYFSAVQKAKIIAFAANSVDPIYKKYHRIDDQHWGTASILSYYIRSLGEQKWEEFETNYEKEKYYKLKNLKEMIAYANEFDLIGAPD